MIKDGVPEDKDIINATPSNERFAKGPVAIIECFQEIPCDPCIKACKRGAISMSNGINGLPSIETQMCNGCGSCLQQCPGLAIFIVDKSYDENNALIKLPYEYIPVPQKGQLVAGLDRTGKTLGFFNVVEVRAGEKNNKTFMVSLIVPRDLAMEIRDIDIRTVNFEKNNSFI